MENLTSKSRIKRRIKQRRKITKFVLEGQTQFEQHDGFIETLSRLSQRAKQRAEDLAQIDAKCVH